ncbi:dCTP deaminase [Enterococcus caccae]|uniref:Deoxycytidine triphosphate deaminase n=1 Tax=Enterococcus caccae ATCC BAA-1240 TaxID=1158612 RepID=R3WP96_9ENTE|nr:deoxycytidine triphosphate deaminase [Enterococcus caccae]EOL43660.1 deoxycytidine triphosphate deaminase [Enterococcus caccae ATCC BAA-1240]EOT67940.1 deoxycytidine triphosphate deaminase [Enterococcus caccae ATCC BAA-1240]OJG28572.1 deoxycytidine triphosphate deaminase [Enterococcus caccae]
MILTGAEIIKEVKEQYIFIEPFHKENVNPNSYNYTLNKELIKIYHDSITNEIREEKLSLTEQGYILEPGILYLGVTNEKIGSSKYATSLIGRSSVGRLGIHLQISANLGHTGTYHRWTLEIRAAKKIRVYPNMKIGQVSFWCNQGQIDLYQGVYKEFNSPHKAIEDKIFSERLNKNE